MMSTALASVRVGRSKTMSDLISRQAAIDAFEKTKEVAK
jgi:hypothetical protein